MHVNVNVYVYAMGMHICMYMCMHMRISIAVQDIEAVYASLPSTCATGPTTGVLVGDRFVTTGDALESHRTRDVSLVWSNPAFPIAPVVAAAEAQGMLPYIGDWG